MCDGDSSRPKFHGRAQSESFLPSSLFDNLIDTRFFKGASPFPVYDRDGKRGESAVIPYQLLCPGFWGTTNHESPRLRPTLRGFASEMGSKSATLRHPAEGRLISPPHLPIRTPEDTCFMPRLS